MIVTYYDWGVIAGGIDPATGQPVVPPGGGGGGGGGVSGPPQPFSGTLTGATTTLTFSGLTVGISIRNKDDSNSLEYSYNNSTWFRISPYGVVQEGAQVAALYLRAVTGTPAYEVLGLLAPVT